MSPENRRRTSYIEEVFMDNEKPSLEELAHHGVLGMKWGKTRAKATSSQIQTARRNVAINQNKYSNQAQKVRETKRGSKERAKETKKLADMKASFLKNPDRVTATRMTRGEKAVAGIFVLSGVGTIPALAAVAGSSAVSRRIEYKQENGKYNKK